jgi:predicted cytidylate kinase
MPTRRSVVINGDLGSGKSTVSRLLAARLGIRRISVGDLYRALAAERGLTALEINLHAQLDDTIDHYVDELQSDIAASGEQLIVDSRLAWHFFTGALKVHLITDPAIAAIRVLDRPGDAVESYASVEEARLRLAHRNDSERDRFLARYGVDKARLSNYDVVCDTTRANADDIVDVIADQLSTPSTATVCFIDPRRIQPPAEDSGPLRLRHTSVEGFVAISGGHTLRAAVAGNAALVAATLATD